MLWFSDHPEVLIGLGISSILIFIISIIGISWFVAQIPEDYFLSLKRKPSQWQEQKPILRLAVLFGKKATEVFSRLKNAEVLGSASRLGDIPTVEDVIGAAQIAVAEFEKGTIGNVYLYGNEFVNTMSQSPFERRILPIANLENDKQSKKVWDYIYEPGSKEILDLLLKRYIETQIYQAVIENNACEQAAKMLAMKNATENAEEIIKELQLVYNNARQAAITQELSEIVGGAAAI